MRSQEMASKVLPVCARGGEGKDSDRDHGEGEPFATRRVWLIEPGDRKAKCRCDRSL